MNVSFAQLSDWIDGHGDLLTWLAGISVSMLIASLILLPAIIICLPKDYFANPRGQPFSLHPLQLTLRLIKNLLGLLFILAGILMLFLPGQGILSLLIGLSLLDFPGKRRMELNIIRRHRVRSTLNWIRHKANKPPLHIPKA